MKKIKKANETPEEREIRLAKQREAFKKWKANETSEKREIRLAKQREAVKKYREKNQLNK